MITEADLVLVADAYADATGANEKTISHRVFGDSKKLAAIRSGADITVRRMNDALAWFSENWPENAVWPEIVSRPFRHDNIGAERSNEEHRNKTKGDPETTALGSDSMASEIIGVAG